MTIDVDWDVKKQTKKTFDLLLKIGNSSIKLHCELHMFPGH